MKKALDKDCKLTYIDFVINEQLTLTTSITMKNEIKVIHENIHLNQVNPNHYSGYKVEIKEYVGRITKKSIIVDIGWIKPVRIAIKNLLDDGCWYYGEGFSTKCYKISSEDLEYVRKLNKINNRIAEIKKEFT